MSRTADRPYVLATCPRCGTRMLGRTLCQTCQDALDLQVERAQKASFGALWEQAMARAKESGS